MKHSNFIRRSLLVFLGLALVFFASSKSDLPNVVIIYADDMGYGDLGLNNPKSKIPTPHLDRLSSEGMRFVDGHSSSGICTPSRFALLTGQHHWRRFHNIVSVMGESVFTPTDFTLAKMFRSKGYETGCIGKWHLGWNWRALLKDGAVLYKNGVSLRFEDYDWSKRIPNGPIDQGFDYYFGDGTINFPPYCWIENDHVIEAPDSTMSKTEEDAPPPEGNWEFRRGPMVQGWDPHEVLPSLTKKAIEWIDKRDPSKPFFLYFPLTAPHAPIIPSKEFLGKSDAGYYGDFVTQVDWIAGQVLNALEAKGLSENTVVIFTADNGPENYAFERMEKFEHWSAGEFRGLKRDVWEGGHRVPLIIRWPGVVGKGIVTDETVSQVDFAATFAKLIGYDLKPDEAIDSYDLLPLLKGKEYTKPLRTATVQNTFDGVFAIRQGDWVYVDASSGTHSKAPVWYDKRYVKTTSEGLLYNLKEDPRQANNRYVNHPEKVLEMKSLLDQYLAGEGCAPHANK